MSSHQTRIKRLKIVERRQARCREAERSNGRQRFLRTLGAVAGAAFVGELVPSSTQGASSAKRAADSDLVRFGKTDLYVTRYCQGTAFRQVPRSDNPEARAILQRCLDVGINFFDSAEAYGWGGSEEVLGKVIAGRRDQLVLCTKAAPSLAPVRDPDTNKFKLGERIALTREALFRKAEGSLKRLGTDYLDLYLIHSPDEVTPPEEIADSMDALVKSGKVRYWGVSNFGAADVQTFFDLGKRPGKAPAVGNQDYYNIVARDRMEPDLLEVFRRIDFGWMAFSPQDAGHLAPGRPVRKGQELVVAALDRVAADLGATRPQVCIAWGLSHPEVTSVLGGAESPEQVTENFQGTRLKLPPESLAVLNAASDAFHATKPKESSS